MRRLLLLLAVLCLAGCVHTPDTESAATPAPGTRAVVLELEDGSRLEAELLRKDARTVHVSVGENVLRLDRTDIQSMTQKGEPEDTGRSRNVRQSGFYATGKGTVRSVSTFAEELGAAVVTVKTPSGLGTGWFCHPDGYVVTNNHVIAGERTISVTAFEQKDQRVEKRVYKKVKLVALDDNLDLALLRIEEDLGLDIPQLIIGDSTKVQVGDPVFTIGNPLGLERTTSDGTVSKVNRKTAGRLYMQITTPIAPGNSGGPLFNERGEVIGVTNMGYIFLDGLAFAIPSKYVKEFLDNVEAFAYDPDNPNSGVKYMEAPLVATDRSLRFDEDAFIKIGHGLTNLTAADVTGDGVDDLVYADNNRSHIGIVTRRRGDGDQAPPPDFEDINRLPENPHFRTRTHAVQSAIHSLAVGDLTGDGRADIVYYGDLEGLAIMEQQEDGSFAAARTVPDVQATQAPGALRVQDVDADGTPDILALGPTHLTVLQGGDTPLRVPLNSAWRDRVRRFTVQDVDGDGRPDLLFFTASARYAAHVLEQTPHGHFVDEYPVAGHLTGEARRLAGPGAPRTFVTADPGKNRVRALSLGTEVWTGGEASAPQGRAVRVRRQRADRLPTRLRVVTFDPEATRPPEFVLADVNADGRGDVVTVAPSRSEFALLLGGSADTVVKTAPSPRNVTALALHRVEGRGTSLFSYSAEDKVFGVSRVDGSGVSYPRPLNVEGEVQSLQMAELAGTELLVWVEKRGRDDYRIFSVPADEPAGAVFDGSTGSVDVQPRELVLTGADGRAREGLARKPARLAFADFNGDGRRDLVVFWAYSGTQSLYLGAAGEPWRMVIDDRKFLEDAAAERLQVADIDGDGRRDVLLPQGEFVRVLRVDQKDKLYVENQFNWPVRGVRRMLPHGDGRYLAVTDDRAVLLGFDADAGRFTTGPSMDLSGVQSGPMALQERGQGLPPDLLIMGRGAVQFVQRRNSRLVFDGRTVYDAPGEYFNYWRAWPADLDGDGQDEVLLFDSRKAMFEVHRQGQDGLRPVLRRRMFEKTIRQSAESDSYEMPAELAIADLDGNGAVDLAFLLGDRLAIYMQKSE